MTLVINHCILLYSVSICVLEDSLYSTSFSSDRTFASRLISRYHPVPMKEREAANRINLQARVAAFLSLMESGKLSEVSLDHSNVDEITKTMDTGKAMF